MYIELLLVSNSQKDPVNIQEISLQAASPNYFIEPISLPVGKKDDIHIFGSLGESKSFIFSCKVNNTNDPELLVRKTTNAHPDAKLYHLRVILPNLWLMSCYDGDEARRIRVAVFTMLARSTGTNRH